MRIIYFDCFSGISGDMIVGALLDAGMPMTVLKENLSRLGVSGYSVSRKKVSRGIIAATKFDVAIRNNSRKLDHTTPEEIFELIDRSKLDSQVKDMSKRIFEVLARAESKIHGKSRNSVHFHEVGFVDSIVDIVGACIGLKYHGIERVYSSALTTGKGIIKTSHGYLPVPAPGTLEVLRGLPVQFGDVEHELVTPTGASIVKTIVDGFGDVPPMSVLRIGYGAGSYKVEKIPNVLRVIIGETEQRYETDTIVVIEANIDDMNPQNFEFLFERLLGEGALDLYVTGVHMKKSRPGFLLTVLANEDFAEKLISIIFDETTTFGVRYYPVNRKKLRKRVVPVVTRFGTIRVKQGLVDGRVMTRSPEYEDCRKLAKEKGVPLRKVYEAATNQIGQTCPLTISSPQGERTSS
jgi:uncharacterized protein (TIGR00299 family) protein